MRQDEDKAEEFGGFVVHETGNSSCRWAPTGIAPQRKPWRRCCATPPISPCAWWTCRRCIGCASAPSIPRGAAGPSRRPQGSGLRRRAAAVLQRQGPNWAGRGRASKRGDGRSARRNLLSSKGRKPLWCRKTAAGFCSSAPTGIGTPRNLSHPAAGFDRGAGARLRGGDRRRHIA